VRGFDTTQPTRVSDPKPAHRVSYGWACNRPAGARRAGGQDLHRGIPEALYLVQGGLDLEIEHERFTAEPDAFACFPRGRATLCGS